MMTFKKRRGGTHPQGFEAGIADFADHHGGKKNQHHRQQVAPVAEVLFLLVQLDDEQGQRGHQARGRGDGEAQEILAGARQVHGGKAVEPRQPERAAQQVNRGDKPAELGVFIRQRMAQHHPMHQKGRRNAKGNQVGQRIKLAAERAFMPAHARHAAIEQIKNARQQNAREGKFDGPPIDQTGHRVRREVGLHDLGQRHEAAEQIPRRQEIRQEVNLQLLRPHGWMAWAGCAFMVRQVPPGWIRRPPRGRRAGP